METRANHVWVGAVTLALLAGLAAFIVWITRLGEGRQNEFDIFFKQSVDGLSKGSSVTFSGVPVGKVKAIELWKRDPAFVRVRIAVDTEVPVLVGTTATMQGSFTGVSNVQLEGATKGADRLVCPEEQPEALCPEGVPVIPTKRGGLGEILSSAPVLIDRLATLSERLNTLFSERNQASIEHILANTDRLTGHLANAGPQIEGSLAELQATLVEARAALASFEKTSNSADALINGDGRKLVNQLNKSLKSVEQASTQLEAVLGDMRPATHQISQTTLPETEAAMRELRAATKALREATEKLNEQGAGALVGGEKLPDYKP